MIVDPVKTDAPESAWSVNEVGYLAPDLLIGKIYFNVSGAYDNDSLLPIYLRWRI